MLSKKTKDRLIAVLVLSLLAMVVSGFFAPRTELEHVISTLPAGDSIYVTDQRENDYRFLQISREGKVTGKIERPLQWGSRYRSYEPLTRDGDAIYVLERVAEIESDLICSENVYRLNFGQKRLDLVWELPVGDGSQYTNLNVQVQHGVLTCFQTDYSGREAKAVLYRAAEGEELTKQVDIGFDIGVGYTEFRAGENGQVLFTTPDGRVILLQNEQEGAVVYPVSRDSSVLYIGEDGEDHVCIGSGDGAVYRVDMTGGKRAEKFFDWSDYEVDPYGVHAVGFGAEDCVTAALENGTSVGLFAGQETEPVILNRLTADGSHVAWCVVLSFLGVWAAALVLALLERGFMILTRGKVPIVTKLLAAFLPVLIASLMIMNTMINTIFRQQLVDSQYERLYLLTSQQTATLNDSYIQELHPESAHDSVYFYEIRAALNLLPAQGTVFYPDGEDTQEIFHANYFWLYKMERGQLVSLVCEQDYMGVPVEARYSSEIAQQFYEAAETGESIRTGFRDSYGDWTVLLTPVLDENGETVAVIETGDTRLSLDYAVAQGAKELTHTNLTVLAILAALLVGILIYTLHPLGILKRRVDDISEGHLGVQAPEGSRDEVGEIARAFNIMSRNVAMRDREIRETSEGYSQFVPAKVFDILDKSSVVDVRLADQTNVDATVLNCSVGAFDDISRSLRSKEMFQMINRVLARLVPVVNSTGGLVDRFDRAGLLAIYTERPEEALDAAVTLCQTLRTAELEEAGGKSLDFHVTISAGPAMIGIVGAEKRLEAMTISEHTSFTGFLKPLAAQYGASVLLTGSAAERIPEFKSKYHARTIGFVYMRRLDQLERIYDVYDGDDEVTRQLKEETADIFEQGVTRFCTHEYYEARLLFIEVLKKNRRDMAAKHYLYLCDTYYHQDSDQKPEIYLETY